MEMTVRDVARMLNVAENTVFRWINERQLPAYQVNDQYRFNQADLLEWARSHHLVVVPLLTAAGATRADPGLAAALDIGGIYHNVGGATQTEVYREILVRQPLPPTANVDVLLGMMVAREASESTAIGDGIALPHVRHPTVLQVAAPFVTLAFLATPLDFKAPDHKPVSCIFSLVSPTVRDHLQLLSRVGAAIRTPGFKALLQKRAAAAEILAEATGLDEAVRAVGTVTKAR